MRAKTVLVKLEMCVLALMLGACTAVPDATQQADNLGAQERNNADLEEELRARLNALRDNPSQASPELIRDLQEVLKALREQQVAQTVNKPAATRQAKTGATKPAPAKVSPVKPKPADVEPSSARPMPSTPVFTAEASAGVRPDTIYASAIQAEQQDRPLQAVALYRHASRLGHALATKRLMEIYTEGLPGISRNYVAAVKFKQLALQQGADIDEKYAQ